MACGCCCKKKVEPADQIIYKPYKERKCTDMFFCLLFIIFWVGMVVIAIVGLGGGDPLRLLYAVDYDGKTCGSDHADKKFVYYPRITEDILTYAQSVGSNPLAINPLDIKLYGVCLAACPALGDTVCNANGETNLKTLMGNLGYTDGTVVGTASQRLQATVKASDFSTYVKYPAAREVKSSCWIVPLKTKDYFYRCMWVREENSNTTEICQSPDSLKGIDVSENSATAQDIKDQCVTKRTRTEKESVGAGQNNPLMDQMLDAAALMGRYVSDAQKAVLPILICGGILALIMGFIWLLILQHLAWCMVWLTIWLVLLALICGTLFAYFKAGLLGQSTVNSITEAAGTSSVDLPLEVESSTDTDTKTRWEYFAYFMTAVTIIITLLVVAMRRKINVAIGIIKEAARAVKSMPLMMTFPFCSVLVVVVLFSYWVIIAGYIYSNGSITAGDVTGVASSALNAASANLLCPVDAATGQPVNNGTGCAGAALGDSFTSSNINNYLLVYHFFGLLWTVNFITGFFTMAIAGAVCFWYFTTNKSHKRRVPVMTGLKTTLMKHMGSVAFGSMIIAIVQLLRAILAYIDRKSKKLQDKNKFLKILFKCLACCLWCFEKCVKYVANSAYIIVAMKGKSFCPAAFEAVMLLIKNIAQVGVLNTVSAFLFALGKLFIMGACGTIVFLWLDNDSTYTEGDAKLSSFWMPVLLTIILAYAVGSAFMNVYELTIDTVLLCYCVDIGRTNAGTADCPYYASPGLLKAVGKKGAVSHKDPGMKRRGSLDDIPPTKDLGAGAAAGAGGGAGLV